MNYQVAIDEFGTATQQSEGWTLVSIADPQAEALAAQAPALLGGGMKKFHGKDFTRKSAVRFRDFLALLRESCLAGEGGFIACTLNDQTWKAEYLGFAERVMEGAFRTAGAPLAPDVAAMLRRVVPPLFTYLRVAAGVGGGHTAAVTLDDSTLLKAFNTTAVSVKGKPFTLPRLAGLLYRAYRDRQFPTSPQVARDEIRTAADETSFLVQAADVVGNFSSAYLFNRLGKASKANDLKAQLFHDVFGDLGIGSADHAASVEVVGDDLRLKQPGAYTFVVA